MKNLTPYNEDSFKFHKNVIARKNGPRDDPEYKQRLANLNNELETLFATYSDLATNVNLETIVAHGFNGQDKKDLLSLYDFRSKILKKLKTDLTTRNGRKFNICEMCTIEPISSFDHIIPKEKFPEFAVNPLNLFPSCKTCNGHKAVFWVENEDRLFLNLYYDLLPQIPYLKINFNPFPIPNFFIDTSGIDEKIAAIIESHYSKLHLFKRYKDNCNDVIDPLVTQAKATIPRTGLDEFRQIVMDSEEEMRGQYGMNYWKSLLRIELVNHPDFDSLLRD